MISLRIPARCFPAIATSLAVCVAVSSPHAMAATQAAAALPLKTGDQGLWLAGLKSIAIATLALLATAGALFYLRGRTGGTPWQALRGGERKAQTPVVLEARRISPKTSLLVVQWQGRTYLLAESAGSTQLLDSRAAAAETTP